MKAAPAIADAPNPVALAPGYQALTYTPPAPGSYQLSSLGSAANGKVLDSSGKALTLHDLYSDKLVLLSFIYSTCNDVNGCPLATFVLQQVRERLLQSPTLAAQVRFITLSFNPRHDTPEVMRRYGEAFRQGGVEWQFLTTASESELQPILAGYQQSIRREPTRNVGTADTFTHILRVYLIDREKQIRNSYTVSFLHPELVFNDLNTLLQESGKKPAPAPSTANHTSEGLDLLHYAQRPQLGLPLLPVPINNPLTREKITLGRKLFFDRRLSLNNTLSCAMCHIPTQGFTSQEQATAVGFEGRSGRRNTPSLFNVAYARFLFHDGRESTLEQQVWGPLLAPNEMAMPAVGVVIDRIRQLPDYQGLFERAFQRGASMETVGMALASYERALTAANSPFDRWYYGKVDNAISATAKLGFALFTGKAACAACHTLGTTDALFTDQGFHNTGLGFRDAQPVADKTRRVQIGPGLFMDMDTASIATVAERKSGDLGRYEITQDPAQRWQYKTPALRNIALTAPYMHNGSLSSLEDVIAFYDQGGVVHEVLDPLIKPLHLTAEEKSQLVDFLQTLTSDDIGKLIEDARNAPVGDVTTMSNGDTSP